MDLLLASLFNISLCVLLIGCSIFFGTVQGEHRFSSSTSLLAFSLGCDLRRELRGEVIFTNQT